MSDSVSKLNHQAHTIRTSKAIPSGSQFIDISIPTSNMRKPLIIDSPKLKSSTSSRLQNPSKSINLESLSRSQSPEITTESPNQRGSRLTRLDTVESPNSKVEGVIESFDAPHTVSRPILITGGFAEKAKAPNKLLTSGLRFLTPILGLEPVPNHLHTSISAKVIEGKPDLSVQPSQQATEPSLSQEPQSVSLSPPAPKTSTTTTTATATGEPPTKSRSKTSASKNADSRPDRTGRSGLLGKRQAMADEDVCELTADVGHRWGGDPDRGVRGAGAETDRVFLRLIGEDGWSDDDGPDRRSIDGGHGGVDPVGGDGGADFGGGGAGGEGQGCLEQKGEKDAKGKEVGRNGWRIKERYDDGEMVLGEDGVRIGQIEEGEEMLGPMVIRAGTKADLRPAGIWSEEDNWGFHEGKNMIRKSKQLTAEQVERRRERRTLLRHRERAHLQRMREADQKRRGETAEKIVCKCTKSGCISGLCPCNRVGSRCSLDCTCAGCKYMSKEKEQSEVRRALASNLNLFGKITQISESLKKFILGDEAYCASISEAQQEPSINFKLPEIYFAPPTAILGSHKQNGLPSQIIEDREDFDFICKDDAGQYYDQGIAEAYLNIAASLQLEFQKRKIAPFTAPYKVNRQSDSFIITEFLSPEDFHKKYGIFDPESSKNTGI